MKKWKEEGREKPSPLPPRPAISSPVATGDYSELKATLSSFRLPDAVSKGVSSYSFS